MLCFIRAVWALFRKILLNTNTKVAIGRFGPDRSVGAFAFPDCICIWLLFVFALDVRDEYLVAVLYKPHSIADIRFFLSFCLKLVPGRHRLWLIKTCNIVQTANKLNPLLAIQQRGA